ncbi:cytochrome b/b6 domain-containing protein [Microbacterium thalassium]|uniref:Thiosulfate reductase cytochrome b subunit n=1 Tax=Microbacterium thalassium TaxID=362649 RepID=A0A7X0FNK3_9MICO|nr:cytochrome b/b6 domain-containing protein [Microbacterium thalassium]MBB6390808.1 thiosulfate reductase cytochrome b subunit [Microbacterium thalassium]GLK25916.1 hypothetical protein GCM10017607_32350 [Microbacterium thalassium]
MATYTATVRQGLPRTPGGSAWPPAGEAPIEVAEQVGTTAEDPAVAVAAAPEVSVAATPVAAAPVAEQPQPVAAPAVAPVAASAVAIRRGLPRTPGGEPWPPADFAAGGAPAVAPASPAAQPAAAAPPAIAETPQPADAPVAAAAAPAAAVPVAAASAIAVRRGLPRTPGGDAWPPADFAAAAAPAPAETAAAAPVPAETAAAVVAAEPTVATVAPAAEVVPAEDYSTPLPFTRTVWAGETAFTRPAPKPEPQRVGPFTKGQWAGAVIIGGAGLLFAAGMVVVAVQWLLSLEFMQEFLADYPGEYHLPESAPVGFPAWLGWQHFFNVFLMVLIIRSGLTIRTEKRPTAFWSPRNNPKRKISLTIWFHQSLDLLWVINGVAFVVLLFVSGQWMRIVPTSWEVFPNALSAALQYVSLDWPTENGWVNYNSLQQLAYFATVFLAAPLAAITGVRMGGLWPKNAKTLNKVYPVEWARTVHFPVMLYFVLFIFVHVVLVLATGALRNLNHMYGAQDADNWVGFWIFVASLVVIAAAWVAARPLVLAPIARLFGKVSGR